MNTDYYAKYCAHEPRWLSENYDLLRKRSFGRLLRSISLKKNDYSPQSIEISDSKYRILATTLVPGQPPRWLSENYDLLRVRSFGQLLRSISLKRTTIGLNRSNNLKLRAPLKNIASELKTLIPGQALSIRSVSDGVDRLFQSLFGGKIDLNSHQIRVALFALKNLLSKERDYGEFSLSRSH